jgi:GAF domain-containing protein
VQTGQFDIAMESLAHSDIRVSDLAHPFVRLLPVSGASVSTFGSLLGAETISATDSRALRVDELQFDLGEGPCWDALATRRPVLRPDIAIEVTPWPAFSQAIVAEDIKALFAFPLVLGPLELGAIDLYSLEPVTLTREQQDQTLVLSGLVSRILLRHAVEGAGSPGDVSPFSRRIIHQATGMVLAQLNVRAEDAYLILQARAFSENRAMHDVANDVVNRVIRFSNDTGPHEEASWST